MRRSLIFILFLFITLTASAQTWEVGGFAGGSGYMGDLNPTKPYMVNNIAYGGVFKRNFDGYFGLKLGYTHGEIEAADQNSDNPHQIDRNLSFFTPVDEISLQLEFNFFNYIPSMSKKRYAPFLFTGAGAVFYNPKTTLLGDVHELRTMGTESQNRTASYNNYALSIPYGAGMKYNFAGKWSLIGELGYRTAFSDYLDDVSGVYPNLNSLPVDDTRRILSDRSVYGRGEGRYLFSPGSQRGDFRKKDTYMFMGLSLTYTFVSSKCPFER